ncbi:hypothetical protein KGQ24_00025 [Patescibacteria group bacterium]|nr:hypothetical protein [Patescibacteria group bacterium]
MNTKKFVLSALAVAFSGIAWFCFAKIFSSPGFLQGNAWYWAGFILAEGISFGFFYLVSITRDHFDFFLTSFLSSLWILAFLGVSLTAALCALGLFAAVQVLNEFPHSLAKTIEVHYFSAAYSKMAVIMLALLAITAVYIQKDFSANINEQEISRNVSQSAANYAWPYLSKYIAEFNSQDTVYQFLTTQFEQQGVPVPTRQMLDQQVSQFSQQLGFNVNGTDRMSNLGERFVANRINDFLTQVKLQRTSILFLVLSMFILWPIGRLIFSLIAVLIYRLFRLFGWVKVMETQITAHHLEI